ncbi:hypothetical protein LG307_10650 [Sutcliffiella horikoshii]|uniref:hypothetical protein n=1 Tax=Sutcliffiella horikoshii TaxID=79883 RepID=UPI00384E6540
MKKTLFVISTILLFAFFGVIVGVNKEYLLMHFNSTKQVHVHNHIESRHKLVSAVWGQEPSSVENLFEISDLVIVGSPINNKEKEYLQPYNDDDTITYTLNNIEISEVLKGEISSGNIDMINYGGENQNGEMFIWEGIEEIKDDVVYLLFLEQVSFDKETYFYRPVEGPSGTYYLENVSGKKLTNSSSTATEIYKDSNINVTEIQSELHRKMSQYNLKDIVELYKQ